MENNAQSKEMWTTAGKILLKLVLLALSVWPIGILEIYLLMLLPAMGMHPVLVVLFMLMPPVLVIGVLFFKPRMKIAAGWAITLLALLVGFGINMAWNVYDESITINTNPNIDLELYLPFREDSRIAVLEEDSSLRFTLEDQLPRVDGAAAVFPVYSAFVNATYPTERTYYTTEKSFHLTTDYFQYNNTVAGYRRLAEKRTDIFFGAYPSQEQLQYATEEGTTFDYTQIGSDAFVFFVHKDNPVDNLTADQIRDIYSGKITNWSQVGGKNEPIVAYQRNANSGSQSQLIRFMAGTPLMDPPKDWVSGSMGGIAQAVADYRSTTASIGFSFRYYIEGIIQNPDIKILSIDGVKPTVETIRDGTYPLGGPLYAVTWEGNENESVQKLLDWVLSPQGQYLIEQTGYVPVGPTE